MAKQKFELSSEIISDELKKSAPKIKAEDILASSERKSRNTLTFATSQAFKSEFKAWCAKKDLSMTAALEVAFELLKNKHGD